MTDEQAAIFSQKLDLIFERVDRLDRHVVGGSEPTRSLLFRVADHEREIEQIRQTREKATGVAWAGLTTGVGALILWVVSKVTGSGGGQP